MLDYDVHTSHPDMEQAETSLDTWKPTQPMESVNWKTLQPVGVKAGFRVNYIRYRYKISLRPGLARIHRLHIYVPTVWADPPPSPSSMHQYSKKEMQAIQLSCYHAMYVSYVVQRFFVYTSLS